jgi:hypothetical protein
MSFANLANVTHAPNHANFMFSCDPIKAKGDIQWLQTELAKDQCSTDIVWNESGGLFYYTPKSAVLVGKPHQNSHWAPTQSKTEQAAQ